MDPEKNRVAGTYDQSTWSKKQQEAKQDNMSLSCLFLIFWVFFTLVACRILVGAF